MLPSTFYIEIGSGLVARNLRVALSVKGEEASGMSNATTRNQGPLAIDPPELQGPLSSREWEGKWTTKCLASSLSLAQ
jgi:hypothetical protein